MPSLEISSQQDLEFFLYQPVHSLLILILHPSSLESHPMNIFFIDLFNFHYIPFLFAFVLGVLFNEYWTFALNQISTYWNKSGKAPALLLLSAVSVVFMMIMGFLWVFVGSLKQREAERSYKCSQEFEHDARFSRIQAHNDTNILHGAHITTTPHEDRVEQDFVG